MAKLTHVNPDNVPDYLTYGLSHAVVAEGGKTVYLSGQVGWNANSESVGPDLAAQLAQAHENIRRVLAAAGGTVTDIVRLKTFGALTGTTLSGLHHKERWLAFGASLGATPTSPTTVSRKARW